MIPSMAIVVGCWIPCEASGGGNFCLAKGILVGVYLVGFTFSGVMNAFGPTVRLLHHCCANRTQPTDAPSKYASEIMPTEIRAAGVASGYFVFNARGVLIVQITPLAIETISWRYFLMFLIMDCIFIVIVALFYPETRNMSLESVGGAFGDKVVNIESDFGEDEKH